MRAPVRSRARAFTAFAGFLASLAVLAVLMAAEIWWLDAAYLVVAAALLVVLSIRALFGYWRYGPLAAYPQSWRRWMTDEYPADTASK